jgi:general secretion pathway protein M
MKTWFESKDPQEQRIIIILGIVIGLALFYLLIWSPISESYAQKTGQVEAQRKLLNWMQSTGQQIAQLTGTAQRSKSTGGRPLLSTVDNTIKASGLGPSMKRLEPQGNDKVQIWFENTNFDQLVLSLGKLSSDHQIQISSINIERQEQPGLVNARLVLIKGL